MYIAHKKGSDKTTGPTREIDDPTFKEALVKRQSVTRGRCQCSFLGEQLRYFELEPQNPPTQHSKKGCPEAPPLTHPSDVLATIALLVGRLCLDNMQQLWYCPRINQDGLLATDAPLP